MVINGSVSLGVRKMFQEQSMINFTIVGIRKLLICTLWVNCTICEYDLNKAAISKRSY